MRGSSRCSVSHTEKERRKVVCVCFFFKNPLRLCVSVMQNRHLGMEHSQEHKAVLLRRFYFTLGSIAEGVCSHRGRTVEKTAAAMLHNANGSVLAALGVSQHPSARPTWHCQTQKISSRHFSVLFFSFFWCRLLSGYMLRCLVRFSSAFLQSTYKKKTKKNTSGPGDGRKEENRFIVFFLSNFFLWPFQESQEKEPVKGWEMIKFLPLAENVT